VPYFGASTHALDKCRLTLTVYCGHSGASFNWETHVSIAHSNRVRELVEYRDS
jgi:hypothetical protein